MFAIIMAMALVQTVPAPDAPPQERPIIVKAEATPPNPAPQEGRLICRRETPTGSTLSRRVCRTEATEQAEEDVAQRAIRRAQRRAQRYGADGQPLP